MAKELRSDLERHAQRHHNPALCEEEEGEGVEERQSEQEDEQEQWLSSGEQPTVALRAGVRW